MLKIFPGISEDSPCYIKPSKYDKDRLSLYYNETSIAILSKDMEIEYKEYIEETMDYRERLKQWITAIAIDIQKEKCPDGILEHIQKHTGQEMYEEISLNRHREWLASLKNLILIFEELYCVSSTVELQLERLQEQYEKYPNIRTKDPNE